MCLFMLQNINSYFKKNISFATSKIKTVFGTEKTELSQTGRIGKLFS